MGQWNKMFLIDFLSVGSVCFVIAHKFMTIDFVLMAQDFLLSLQTQKFHVISSVSVSFSYTFVSFYNSGQWTTLCWTVPTS